MKTSKFSTELETAIQAAKNGASQALKYFGKNPEVNIKADKTPVTIADREGENVIRETILKKFPDAEFVGEEMGGELNKKSFWIIDPIDGTKNFMRGIGLWSILISYYSDGEFKVGVSYVPVLDEMVYAERGKGAYLNGKQIHVSSVQYLENAFISHGETRYFDDAQGLLSLSKRVLAARGFGDAWSYHLVASGRVDAMLEAHTNIWDVAPFVVIIEEAGGKFSTLSGELSDLSSSSAIASNGVLHDEIVRIVNTA